jgi:PIN domain nuclease of toxin-antitoxin system
VSGLLLDTHALIWWSARSARLSAAAHASIVANAGAVWVSAASIYEADYKARVGRMPPLPVPAMEIVRAEGFLSLPIADLDAAQAAAFDTAHADPFDRLIAAQARTHDMLVATKDPAIAAMGARVVW